jgi:predicted NodU family carbamoyl transferase
MKIVGVNISHDTSVAEVENGKLISCHDEARFRRHKYWDPDKLDEDHDRGLQCIVQAGIEEPDHLIFATFDRRNVIWHIDGSLIEDRLLAEEFAKDCQAEQLTYDRCMVLQEKYKDHLEVEFLQDGDSDMRVADMINDYHWQKPAYHLEPEHHFYHAECCYHLSPYLKDNEDAIAVVWDGGGAMRLFDDYPGYQEIETIYRCRPGVEPHLQWQKLSNHRVCMDIGWQFANQGIDQFHCPEDIVTTSEDGVELVITSNPSSGMNFSQMSVALGADTFGGAAGKVMGMASYSAGVNTHQFWSNFSVAQQLEEDTLKASIETIQKAVDLNPDCKNIVLSGGYSLNCTNNYKYLDAFPDHQFFVDPIPHDGGTAAGAALWFEREVLRAESQENQND